MKVICKTCGKEFPVYPSVLKQNRGKFCSPTCKNISQIKDRGPDRFCAKCGKKLLYRQKNYCSRKCRPPWNKGIKGVQVAWNKNKICPQIRGEKHGNWKGGITDKARAFRNSLEYKLWRIKVLKKDNYICYICRERGGRLESDHIKPYVLYPELALEVNNGRAVHHDCHRKNETYGGRVFRICDIS